MNVGFSNGEVVDDSVMEVEDSSETSSSARTWPRRAEDEHRADSNAALKRIFAIHDLDFKTRGLLVTGVQ